MSKELTIVGYEVYRTSAGWYLYWPEPNPNYFDCFEESHPLVRKSKADEAISELEAKVEALEGVLRDLASYLGAGGHNAVEVDPEVFRQKILWGIDEHTKMVIKLTKDGILKDN